MIGIISSALGPAYIAVTTLLMMCFQRRKRKHFPHERLDKNTITIRVVIGIPTAVYFGLLMAAVVFMGLESDACPYVSGTIFENTIGKTPYLPKAGWNFLQGKLLWYPYNSVRISGVNSHPGPRLRRDMAREAKFQHQLGHMTIGGMIRNWMRADR
jgi:hypothetical protein